MMIQNYCYVLLETIDYYEMERRRRRYTIQQQQQPQRNTHTHTAVSAIVIKYIVV